MTDAKTPKKRLPARTKNGKRRGRPPAHVKLVGDLQRATAYLRAIGELGKPMHPLMTESELVGRLEAALAELFPGAPYVLRTLDTATGRFLVRLAHALPRPVPEVVTAAQAAGAHAAREGKAVRLKRNARSETAPRGTAAVVPLQVGFHLLGYLETATGPDDGEALHMLEMLGGQFAVALRSLQSTEEARNWENFLASVVDTANSILVITGPEGRISFFNRYAERLSGYSRDEVVGKNLLRVFKFHKGDREGVRRVLVDALAGRLIDNFEARYVAKNDEVRYALFNAAPIFDVRQKLTGVIVTGVDLTEHKRLERQVLHTEKLASLGEMAAGIAHELNNPLTAIYTNADLQLRIAGQSERDENEKRRLAAILEGAERIRGLVRNLTGYARPGAEELAPLEINHVIERALSFCNYEVTRYGVTLRRDLAESLPPVHGVPGQLQQVLVNLLTNASHAVPQGAGVITVRTKLVESSVCLQVEDNGAGIPAAHLDKIFQPFFSTKAEGEGTGLGLSIVMRILEKHGARLEVRTREGAGATFSIVFPPAPEGMRALPG